MLWSVLFLVAAVPLPIQAVLWKTEADLTAKYGEPVTISRIFGDRTFTYEVEDLKLDVQFQDGVSQRIKYEHKDRQKPFSPGEIDALLKANSEGRNWNRKIEGTWELGVPPATASVRQWDSTHYLPDGRKIEEKSHLFEITTAAFTAKTTARSLLSLWTHSRSGTERRFQGVLEFKDEEDEQRVAIIRDGSSVLEIRWAWRGYPGKAKLEVGQNYEFTLRDEDLVDLDAPLVFVSDRVHKSHGDRVSDSEFFPLVRVKQAGTVVYDESVCEVHKAPMQRTTAEIDYGLYGAASKADAFCDREYPHHADSIRGGCLVGDVKFAVHYVCRECVVATERYKREHPEDAIREF